MTLDFGYPSNPTQAQLNRIEQALLISQGREQSVLFTLIGGGLAMSNVGM